MEKVYRREKSLSSAPKEDKQMKEQLSFEFEILSSGKQKSTSPRRHLSSKKEEKAKQKNQGKQPVKELLPRTEKEHKLKTLSLEGVKTEENPLKEAPPLVQSPKEEKFFGNRIHLISAKTVAEMLGLAPKTIHNWVYLRKIPYVKCGQKVMFRPKSLKAWLNRKEVRSWL